MKFHSDSLLNMRCTHTSRRMFLRGAAAAVLGGVPAVNLLASMSKKPLPGHDLSFLGTGIEVMQRSAWTAMEAQALILKPAGYFDRITIHHTGAFNNHFDKDEVAQDMEAIQLVHHEREYGDIGYHFVVDASGRVWEGRSLAYEGAHVGGQNDNNIGIVLLGNFEEQTVSAQADASLLVLIQRLRLQYQIKSHRLYGHRDLGKSLCPGQNLYSRIVKLRGVEAKKTEGKNDGNGSSN
jgi:hypothetical protein